MKRRRNIILLIGLLPFMLASGAYAQQAQLTPKPVTASGAINVSPPPAVSAPFVAPSGGAEATGQILAPTVSSPHVPNVSTSNTVVVSPTAGTTAKGTVKNDQISQNVTPIDSTPLPALPANTQSTQSTDLPKPIPVTAPQMPTNAPQPAVMAQPAGALPAPKTISIPVPNLPTATPVAGTSMILALNKTQGIDLDKEVRDVIIGNPDIADIVVRSQKQVYLIGKKTGDTNIFFSDAQGNLIRKIDIIVQPDVDGIQSNISEILPAEHISVRGMGDSVVLSGTVSSDGVAAKAHDIARHFVGDDAHVISMMRVSNEQQVLLRVRVAEAKKSVLKELGVENLLSPQTLGPLTIDAATSALGLGPGIAGAIGIGTSDSQTNIRLLEQQGYIRTLAEPNLLAVSGETASMLAGGEYPIPTAQENNTITVTYKPFGVILSFLPVVLDTGRISLRISTEVSAPSDQNTVVANGFTFKSFITRRANSVVELPSGGEVMIAGLLQNDITGSLNGVPGIMDLPIIGALFRSSSFQRSETELVVLVSAVLAKPADPKQFSLPSDGFAPATDLDRYFLGHLQNVYVKKPPHGPNTPQNLQGPLGYIVQ